MTTPYTPADSYHATVTVPAGTDKPRAVIFAVPYQQLADNAESVRLVQRRYNQVGGNAGAAIAVPSFMTNITALSIVITPRIGDWMWIDFNCQLTAQSSTSAVAARVQYFSTSQSIVTIPQSQRAVNVTSNGTCLHLRCATQAVYAEAYTFQIGMGLNIANAVDIADTWFMSAECKRGNY